MYNVSIYIKNFHYIFQTAECEKSTFKVKIMAEGSV